MTEGASKKRRHVASANVAVGAAIAFVVASALLSFVPDRPSAANGWRLRGALGPGSPLPAATKPV